jgi:hypothetical protein
MNRSSQLEYIISMVGSDTIDPRINQNGIYAYDIGRNRFVGLGDHSTVATVVIRRGI